MTQEKLSQKATGYYWAKIGNNWHIVHLYRCVRIRWQENPDPLLEVAVKICGSEDNFAEDVQELGGYIETPK